MIYDIILSGDRGEWVVNQEDSLAAKENQKIIKEKFRSWGFSDPESASAIPSADCNSVRNPGRALGTTEQNRLSCLPRALRG